MHDWGSGGRLHPRAQIHQVAGRRTTIDGIKCDVNTVYATDWGQWTPGSTGQNADPLTAEIPLEQLIAESAELSSQLPQTQGLLPR
ncbi:hypothetical protein UL81_09440 [Corynebacterium camporealensis]|uniref:Uncharacterized protein n=1 Tax=Corynebacterium camporealensis TaxID=161896 RepID=A0A0F6QX68_9CORY|nr:hypothetical protein UL81_09440 [Corynebacterium camporealensis]